MILEDLALEYIYLSEGNFRRFGYELIVLGGIVACVVNRNRTELSRVPYFACSSSIVLMVSAVQIIWLQLLPAMVGGYLWMLTIVSIIAPLAGGFLYGMIAIARSRDAYGHGGWGALAFIPVANFWLLFTPSKKVMSPNRIPTISLLNGDLGILVGIFLIIASVVVSAFFNQEINRITSRAENDPSLQRLSIEFLIRSQGLEETLRIMAAEARTPIAVDEVTTLARIEALDLQLRRIYIVSLDDVAITEKFRTRSTNGICAHPPFVPLLRGGATINEVYVKTDGSPIGSIIVTQQNCSW